MNAQIVPDGFLHLFSPPYWFFNPTNFSKRLVFSVDCLSTRLDAQILKSNILKYVKPQLAGWYYQMTQKILSCISTFC